MAYDRWFNNPLVVLAAFNGVSQKVIAKKPEFNWHVQKLMADDTPLRVQPRWIRKLGSFYVAGVDLDPDSNAMKKALFYSSDPASGWQLGTEQSYSAYNDPSALCVVSTGSGLVAVGLEGGESINPSMHICDYNVSWASGPAAVWSSHKIHYKWVYENEQGEEVEQEGDLASPPVAIAYGGGTYVICVRMGHRLRILCASAPKPAYWEQNAPEVAGDTQEVIPTGMLYANGQFVICGYVQTNVYSAENSSFLPFVATASDPMGEWSFRTIGSSTCYLRGIRYQNGMYTALGRDAANKLYVYYASTAGGAWARRYIADANEDGDVVYANGCWLISYSGFGEYENPIDKVGTNIASEHIAITDDLATGRILKCRYVRDPYASGIHFAKPDNNAATRMLYDNGKLMLLGCGRNLLVGEISRSSISIRYIRSVP